MNDLILAPQQPATTEFATVAAARSAITAIDAGEFRTGAILIRRMMWNARLAGVVHTRIAGHIATAIRWEPATENRDGRRAAKEIEQDFPLMLPLPVRRKMLQWGLLLGVDFCQRVPMVAPSGRRLPVLRHYWPGFASWNWHEQRYRVQTRHDGFIYVDSPSRVTTLDTSESPWLVHEPFGEESWLEGYAHSVWRAWFGHDSALGDMSRCAEKHGIGIAKLYHPAMRSTPTGTQDSGKPGASLAEFTSRWRAMGRDGVVPLQRDDDGNVAWDLAPYEFTGTGFQAITEALGIYATALAIVILGHNLTAEVKGGSFAAAGIGDYIRTDKRVEDAASEEATIGPQLLRVWAAENYGDPDLAPRPVYVTDPPTVNQQSAATLQSLAQAITQLRVNAPRADVDALLERFRVPLLAEGRAQVTVPGGTEQDGAAESAPDAMPSAMAQPVDTETQAEAMPARVEIPLTATDWAAVVKVDQALASLQLPSIGGDIGGRFVVEHAAKIKADAAPEIATAAKAESGTAPGEAPPAPAPFGGAPPTDEPIDGPDEENESDDPADQ